MEFTELLDRFELAGNRLDTSEDAPDLIECECGQPSQYSGDHDCCVQAGEDHTASQLDDCGWE